MDDPWGSPWADEVQLPKTIKLEDKEGLDVKNRPTTPARAATLVLQEKTNSPWDDAEDDGFGEWATMPADNGRGMGLDGQADDWETDTPAQTVTTKPDVSAISLNWGHSQETQAEDSLNLAPNPLLKPSNLARLPSPDPWATSFTNDDEAANNIPQRVEDVVVFASEAQDEESQEHISENPIPELFDDESLPGEKDTRDQEGPIVHGTNDVGLEDVDNIASPVIMESRLSADVLDGDPFSSRTSPSPSEHSQHDELSQESPRTSFDEEPKRPQVPRKVSSKVQELVEHFDGLAKPEFADTTSSSTSSGQDTIKAVEDLEVDLEDEEEDDFGDFEEGQSDDEQEVVEEPAAPAQDQRSKKPVDHEGPLPPQAAPRRFIGPVDFDIDTSVLEKLYPDFKPDATFEKVFVPDTIPYDSFSTTEERKTWYRVSRYGTMRKHNTGDDDYIRINWPQSQIRKDTLEIVARWMEEDRISGRVVLGGASKGSSIFGWGDKRAAPVPLAHAFAAATGKRKVEVPAEKAPEIPREWPQELARKSSTSRRSPSRNSRRSSVKPSQSLEETKSALEAPVANFGWNATPQKAQNLDNHVLPGHKSAGSLSVNQIRPMKAASPPRRSSSVKRSENDNMVNPSPAPVLLSSKPVVLDPKPSISTNQKRLTSLATSDLANEDDNWGEMVASPVIKTPSHASPGPLLQSQDVSPSTLTQIPMLANASATQLGASHRSNPSFDDIPKPLPASSKIMESPVGNLPPDAFGVSAPNAVNGSSTISSITPATGVAADPWAMADFSFFETTPGPAPAPAIKRAAPAGVKPVSKSVSFSPSPLGPGRSGRKSREEIEQDKIVQSVVKSLPDLSYMLRK